jgi:hypothetical protein
MPNLDLIEKDVKVQRGVYVKRNDTGKEISGETRGYQVGEYDQSPLGTCMKMS